MASRSLGQKRSLICLLQSCCVIAIIVAPSTMVTSMFQVIGLNDTLYLHTGQPGLGTSTPTTNLGKTNFGISTKISATIDFS